MAAEFDGSSMRLLAVQNSSIDDIFSAGGTIMGWFVANTFGENNTGRIIDKRNLNTGWTLFVSSTNSNLRFGMSSGGNTVTLWSFPANSVVLGTHQHFAVVFNTSNIANTPVYYVNGQVVTTGAADVPPVNPFDADNTVDLMIGGRRDSEDRTFDGALEDIRMYRRELSAAEIMSIYVSKGHDFVLKDLAARWLFNDLPPGVQMTQAFTARDSGPFGNHLDFGQSSDGPIYTEGKLSFKRRILRA